MIVNFFVKYGGAEENWEQHEDTHHVPVVDSQRHGDTRRLRPFVRHGLRNDALRAVTSWFPVGDQIIYYS